MIELHVESNFSIELAMLQAKAADCERILKGAEQGKLQLVTPAVCLIEPLYQWRGRTEALDQTGRDLKALADELGRSSDPSERTLEAALRQTVLAESKLGQDRRQRLANVLSRLCAVARVLPIDGPTLSDAYQQHEPKGMKAQDAVVLASVLRDAAQPHQDPVSFLTFDGKDFVNAPLVRAALRAANVKTFSTASALFGWLSHHGVVV